MRKLIKYIAFAIGIMTIVASGEGGSSSDSASDAPSAVNSPPVYTGAAIFNVEENDAFTISLPVNDAEGSDIEFTLITIGSHYLFNLSASGVLAPIQPFDFEDPKDFRRENKYEITFEISDGEDTTREKIKIYVEDVEEKFYDYGLKLSCANHDLRSFIDRYTTGAENNVIWDLVTKYGQYRSAINLQAVTATGQVLETFNTNINSGGAVSGIGYGDNGDEEYTSFVNRNLGEYLQITCVYSGSGNIKELKYRVKLDQSDKWLENENGRNSSYHPISALSDLYLKIDEANAINRIDNDVLSQFTGRLLSEDAYYSTFNGSQLCSSYNCEYGFLSERNGIQNRNMRALYLLAYEYTESNLETLNNLIVEEYVNSVINSNDCSIEFICAAFFDHTGARNPESSFENNLASWSEFERAHSGALITTDLNGIREETKVRISLTATPPSNESTLPAMKKIYQTIEYKSDHFMLSEFEELTSGNNSFGNFGGGSGMAGFYACAKADTDYVGCNYFVSFEDVITLPIAVGNRYQVNDTETAIISPPFTNTRYFVDLDRILSKIPSVQNNITSITDIEYGLVVYEDRDSSGGCDQCFATLESNELSIFE